MDDIIPVLAIDFRPTSRRDDSYVSLCDTVHVIVYSDENHNLFPTYHLPVGRTRKFRFPRILRCQENKTKRVFSGDQNIFLI